MLRQMGLTNHSIPILWRGLPALSCGERTLWHTQLNLSVLKSSHQSPAVNIDKWAHPDNTGLYNTKHCYDNRHTGRVRVHNCLYKYRCSNMECPLCLLYLCYNTSASTASIYGTIGLHIYIWTSWKTFHILKVIQRWSETLFTL